eukprot:scaffold1417_cov258-Pinguiococcus_pyrenoidosus.AAC.1
MSIKGMGFGYAPGPNKQLRQRLSVIHGAKVTLIDEHKTSKLCHVCKAELEDVTVTKRKYFDAEADKFVRRPPPSQRPGLELRE